MDRAEQLAVLSGPAADQWGLITAAQAKDLGLSAVQLLRLTEAGLLDNVSRGIYLLTASGMPRHVDIKAAWLRLQPGEFAWNRGAGHPDSGVVSHASACQLHELGDIPAPDVELTVPRRRTTTEPFVRLRTASLEPDEITVVDGLPVTTTTRTITDLLKAKADGGHIGGVIADAERRGLLALDDLAERLLPYARKYGMKANATGRDLIDHLVKQAGESLHRRDVARASKEGFDAALDLLAERPDLANYLSHRMAGGELTVRQVKEAVAAQLLSARAINLSPIPDLMEVTGLHTTFREMHRQLAQAASLTETIQEMNQLLAQPDLIKSFQEINRQIALPHPGLAAAYSKLLDPHPLAQAMRDAAALSPGVRKALESAAETTAHPEPELLPAPYDGPGDESGDSRPEKEEAGGPGKKS